MSYFLAQLEGAARRRECQQHDAELARSLRTFTRAARMVTTSAGVTIGIAWQPAPPQFSRDAESIQAALLEPRTAREPSLVQRVLGLLWRLA